MKSFKLPVYFLAAALILSIATSCSKKSTPPAKTSTYGLTITFAGNGTAGAADSTGTGAGFSGPGEVVVDAAGNIYVADTENNLIRKVTPGGVVTTIAGNGNKGLLNGTGLLAAFNTPFGIAIDAAGNLYVADSGNNLIRKISTSGVVTTLAGNGTTGAANGTDTAATFNNPYGIAVDAAGNVYVGDTGNNLIRKVTAAGVVTTLAGSGTPGNENGTGTLASFNAPQGLTMDAAGNLYVADYANQLIREITPAGAVTTFAGTGTQGSMDGSLASATFNGPAGLTFDAQGNMYVTDVGNSVIRKITPAGTVSTLAGNGVAGFVNGIGTGASFNQPYGIAVDHLYNAYVADLGNNVIRKIIVKQ